MDSTMETLDLRPYGYGDDTAAPDTGETWALPEVDAQGKPITSSHRVAPDPEHLEEQFRERMGEETRRSFEKGYERGREDGAAAERAGQSAARSEELQRIAAAIGSMVEGFAGERSRYYERLEQEAVRLALAIAGRILRREAQMDPLFLLGAVRVALGQLTSSTTVRLRVPSADRELWAEALALLPNRDTRPEVIAAEEMRVGQCVMETELGSVDLGVRAQMGEIERQMFEGAPAAPDAAQMAELA